MTSLVNIINYALTIGICLAAVWKGGFPERVASIVYLIAWLISLFFWTVFSNSQAQLAVLIVDLILLGVFSWLVWKFNRTPLMWAAAFQSIDVAIHVASLLALHVAPYAYFWSLWLSAYGVLGAIAVATWNAWREQDALAGSTGSF